MPLHLHLEKVLRYFVTPQVWKTRVLNQYASHEIFFYDVAVDNAKRFRTSHESRSAIRFDHVVLYETLAANEHDAVVVT